MRLAAHLNLECTHRYDNGERGIVYSTLVLNELYPRPATEVVTVVVHNPPASCISLAPAKAELESSSRSPTGNIWIIKGLFYFHERQTKRPYRGPKILHANPVLDPQVRASAVFLTCSNRSAPTSDVRYTVEAPTPALEPIVFPSELGPIARRSAEGYRKQAFSNLLVGVAPLGSIVHKTWWSRTWHRPLTTCQYLVHPDTGVLEKLSAP